MTKTKIQPGFVEWLDISDHEEVIYSTIHTTARELTVEHHNDNTFIIRIPHGSRFEVRAYVEDDGKYELYLRAGTYTVNCSVSGHDSKSVSVDLTTDKEVDFAFTD